MKKLWMNSFPPFLCIIPNRSLGFMSEQYMFLSELLVVNLEGTSPLTFIAFATATATFDKGTGRMRCATDQISAITLPNHL